MKIADTLRKTIEERLQKDPKIVLPFLARELAVPEQAIMECLPESEIAQTGPENFDEVMAMIATWGQVTTIVQTGSVVLEAKGMLPMGSHGHGYFNLLGGRDYNVGGHIRADLVAVIYFVERPFMGMDTKSVQFFDLSGDSMLKIYLGRDEKRQLLADQVELFCTLRQRVTKKAGCGCCS